MMCRSITTFLKAPNSTCSVTGPIPVNTSRKIVLAPCHKCPKKNNKAKLVRPNVYHPRGLLRNTPSDSKLVLSKSNTSPNCAFLANFLTVGASLNDCPLNLPP